MTMPYSASLYGFTDQLIEELNKAAKHAGKQVLSVTEKPEDRTEKLWLFDCARYLAAVNQRAIGQVVVKMFAAMQWFREVAGIVGKAGRDIEWTTPVGLHVVQRYRKTQTKRLDLWFGSINYRPCFAAETDKPNVEGHRNGISPNFIHSMDGAHLIKIALHFSRPGLCLGVVHDSFSTHACNVDYMRDVVRGEFVAMYGDTDWLSVFYKDLVAANPDLDIPAPPTQGGLDVAEVKASDYFIS
jgi:DNA-directed RNA polymerase